MCRVAAHPWRARPGARGRAQPWRRTRRERRCGARGARGARGGRRPRPGPRGCRPGSRRDTAGTRRGVRQGMHGRQAAPACGVPASRHAASAAWARGRGRIRRPMHAAPLPAPAARLPVPRASGALGSGRAHAPQRLALLVSRARASRAAPRAAMGGDAAVTDTHYEDVAHGALRRRPPRPQPPGGWAASTQALSRACSHAAAQATRPPSSTSRARTRTGCSPRCCRTWICSRAHAAQPP